MAERQFKLINSVGAEFNLNQYGYAWLHAPDGLGWSQSVENVQVGNALVTTRTLEDAPSPTGEIIFRSYEAYDALLDFVQQGGLVLGYMPLNTWRYLDCVIQLDKSEIKPENDRLICPVTFIARSYWYEALQIYQFSGEIKETDKKYRYTYAYTYGNVEAGTIEILNGRLPSFFKLTIQGPVNVPRYRLLVNGTTVYDGAINAEVPEGHQVIVNTDPANMEIAEYNGDTWVRDLYGLSDFSTVRIFELPPGESMMVLSDSSTATPEGYLEVKKRV